MPSHLTRHWPFVTPMDCSLPGSSILGFDARDVGLIPGSRRCPGEGHCNAFQFSCLENPMHRGAWQATVHEVTKGQIQLSDLEQTTACQASLTFIIFWSLLKIISRHLILCHPLLPPSIFPSTSVFANESALRTRWSKNWNFSFSISPSNEHLGLISFRMDWLDLLAVQGTLKSLLQHHNSKASIIQCSAFFMVQPYTHACLLEKP